MLEIEKLCCDKAKLQWLCWLCYQEAAGVYTGVLHLFGRLRSADDTIMYSCIHATSTESCNAMSKICTGSARAHILQIQVLSTFCQHAKLIRHWEVTASVILLLIANCAFAYRIGWCPFMQ